MIRFQRKPHLPVKLATRKFVLQLEQWMTSEDLDEIGLAELMDVHVSTVVNWLSGTWLPNRDHALLLAYYSEGILSSLRSIAKMGKFQQKYKARRSLDVAVPAADSSPAE